MKFIIIGFPKCGQHSMAKYLKARFGITDKDILNPEIIWNKTALEEYEKNWADKPYKLMILTRNIHDFVYSGFNFWKYRNKMSFEQFLDYKIDLWKGDGKQTVIDRANFEKWIKPFYKFNPIILDIDELKLNPNFPHFYKTENLQHQQIPPITQEERDMIDARVDF